MNLDILNPETEELDQIITRVVSFDSPKALEIINNVLTYINETLFTNGAVIDISNRFGLTVEEKTELFSGTREPIVNVSPLPEDPEEQKTLRELYKSKLIYLGQRLKTLYDLYLAIDEEASQDIANQLGNALLSFSNSAIQLLYGDEISSKLLKVRGIDPESRNQTQLQPTQLALDVYKKVLADYKISEDDPERKYLDEITQKGFVALAQAFLSNFSGTDRTRTILSSFAKSYYAEMNGVFDEYINLYLEAIDFGLEIKIDFDFLSIKVAAMLPGEVMDLVSTRLGNMDPSALLLLLNIQPEHNTRPTYKEIGTKMNLANDLPDNLNIQEITERNSRLLESIVNYFKTKGLLRKDLDIESWNYRIYTKVNPTLGRAVAFLYYNTQGEQVHVLAMNPLADDKEYAGKSAHELVHLAQALYYRIELGNVDTLIKEQLAMAMESQFKTNFNADSNVNLDLQAAKELAEINAAFSAVFGWFTVDIMIKLKKFIYDNKVEGQPLSTTLNAQALQQYLVEELQQYPVSYNVDINYIITILGIFSKLSDGFTYLEPWEPKDTNGFSKIMNHRFGQNWLNNNEAWTFFAAALELGKKHQKLNDWLNKVENIT